MVHRWAREMKEAFRGWGEASVEMGVNVEYVGETLRGRVVEWRRERDGVVKEWVEGVLKVNR